jgi:hypothetical protein
VYGRFFSSTVLIRWATLKNNLIMSDITDLRCLVSSYQDVSEVRGFLNFKPREVILQHQNTSISSETDLGFPSNLYQLCNMGLSLDHLLPIFYLTVQMKIY